MKKKDKKLVLNKETITTLERDQLGVAGGGLSSDACSEGSCYCPIIVRTPLNLSFGGCTKNI